jgi:probable phosphoglycerate mutase
LVETDCGEWTGASIEELARTDLWRLMQSLPSCARHPGGESVVEVQARIVAAIEDLRGRHLGERIAVVSHSDPIKLLLAFHVGLHLDMFQRLVIAPASISELEFDSLRPRLVRSNDCSHLRVDVSEEK